MKVDMPLNKKNKPNQTKPLHLKEGLEPFDTSVTLVIGTGDFYPCPHTHRHVFPMKIVKNYLNHVLTLTLTPGEMNTRLVGWLDFMTYQLL